MSHKDIKYNFFIIDNFSYSNFFFKDLCEINCDLRAVNQNK